MPQNIHEFQITSQQPVYYVNQINARVNTEMIEGFFFKKIFFDAVK